MNDDYVEVPVVLPADAEGRALKFYVEARRPEGETPVGALDVVANFDDVSETIRTVVTRIGDALRAASPDKFSIELGFELKMDSGILVALLAHGGASATIKITLDWEASSPKAT